jgi:hypothetical protein
MKKSNLIICFSKKEFGRDLRCGDFFLIDSTNLGKTHIQVATCEDIDLERAFEIFQGENWNRTGQQNEHLKALGCDHSSISVGDVIVADGEIFAVDSWGFKKIA